MKEREIQRLVRTLGIGATYRGYRYLNYGIELCMQDENYLLAVSKLLYPKIAKEYSATSSSVERDIRTVINVCWERGNQQLLKEISFRPLNAKPTSSVFLDILVDHLNHKDQDKKTVGNKHIHTYFALHQIGERLYSSFPACLITWLTYVLRPATIIP